jgi:E3 ubiquitin-protein ligase SHPRH
VPPSSILGVNWWRVCIDEAQIVESAAGAAAQMCARLNAINRWCVTGTPLSTSVAELHGLMCCLRARPFTNEKHFNLGLINPYVTGRDERPLVNTIAHLMCRTMKRSVQLQVSTVTK